MITLSEEVRRYAMDRNVINVKKSVIWNRVYCPAIAAKIEESKDIDAKCYVKWDGRYSFEVEHKGTYHNLMADCTIKLTKGGYRGRCSTCSKRGHNMMGCPDKNKCSEVDESSNRAPEPNAQPPPAATTPPPPPQNATAPPQAATTTPLPLPATTPPAAATALPRQ